MLKTILSTFHIHLIKNAYSYLKCLILVSCYSFLIYKLISINQYDEFFFWWKNTPLTNFIWLLIVLFLLPFNWLFESYKWKVLISNAETLSLKKTINSVLVGIVSGFFTPNRIGEVVGRVIYLKEENRKFGVTLSIINSLTQNFIMAIVGIPAFVWFLIYQNKNVSAGILYYLISIIIVIILVIGFFYVTLQYVKRNKKELLNNKIESFISGIQKFTKYDLIKILLLTVIRYIIFCFQFYCMLQFFGVEIVFFEALFAIPSTYLLVTFTPSLAFSEAAIRSTYAVFIIGAFSSQDIQIIMAGIGIWVVNFVFPMLVGSFLLWQTNKSEFLK